MPDAFLWKRHGAISREDTPLKLGTGVLKITAQKG